eukprot:1435959-Alexandrium_andersonii.AAC.1
MCIRDSQAWPRGPPEGQIPRYAQGSRTPLLQAQHTFQYDSTCPQGHARCAREHHTAARGRRRVSARLCRRLSCSPS